MGFGERLSDIGLKSLTHFHELHGSRMLFIFSEDFLHIYGSILLVLSRILDPGLVDFGIFNIFKINFTLFFASSITLFF